MKTVREAPRGRALPSGPMQQIQLDLSSLRIGRKLFGASCATVSSLYVVAEYLTCSVNISLFCLNSYHHH